MRKREALLLVLLLYFLFRAANATYEGAVYENLEIVDQTTLLNRSDYWRPSEEQFLIGLKSHIKEHCESMWDQICVDKKWDQQGCYDKALDKARNSPKLTSFEIGGIFREFRSCGW